MGKDNRFKIPVLKIITNIFSTIWLSKIDLIKKTFIPVLFIVAIGYLENSELVSSSPLMLIFFLIGFASYVLIAVTIHRIVILGSDSAPKFGIQAWTSRETRFLGWLIIIGLIVYAIVLGLLFVSIFLSPLFGIDVTTFFHLLVLPVIYLVARVVLIFPAIAVDNKPDLSWAWKVSSGNVWRLIILAGILPYVTALLMDIVDRDNSVGLENFLLVLVSVFFLIIEITAVSLIYKEFSRNKKDFEIKNRAPNYDWVCNYCDITNQSGTTICKKCNKAAYE